MEEMSKFKEIVLSTVLAISISLVIALVIFWPFIIGVFMGRAAGIY